MVRDLPPDKYKELDKLLKDKFGHGLFDADKKYLKRIDKIIEKGKISNEEQYYMLKEYLERIWGEEGQKERTKRIDEMLKGYEDNC